MKESQEFPGVILALILASKIIRPHFEEKSSYWQHNNESNKDDIEQFSLNEMLDLVGGLGISAICSSIPALLAHQRCLTIYDPLEINDYEVESKIFASVSNAMRIKNI